MQKHILIFIFSLSLLTASAQSPGFGKTSSGDHAFRIYYFAYNIVNPGFMMGPEYDFLWQKTDKISCETGARYIDKHLLFVPQFGAFTDEFSNLSIFVNIEVDYQIIYDKGWIFEMFASPGYALKFGDGVTSMKDEELDQILTETRGEVMPQIGLGTGYNFKKKDISDMSINFRLLNCSSEIKKTFFLPAAQLGITYNL